MTTASEFFFYSASFFHLSRDSSAFFCVTYFVTLKNDFGHVSCVTQRINRQCIPAMPHLGTSSNLSLFSTFLHDADVRVLTIIVNNTLLSFVFFNF